jgi:hypothetical protein
MKPCKRENFVQPATSVIKEKYAVLVAIPAQGVKIQEPNAPTVSPIDLGDLKGQQNIGHNANGLSIHLPLCRVLLAPALRRVNPTRIRRP